MNLNNLIKSILFFALLSLAAVLVGDKLVMPFYVAHNNEIIVPNVLNKDYDEAKKILEKIQLTVTKKTAFRWKYPSRSCYSANTGAVNRGKTGPKH